MVDIHLDNTHSVGLGDNLCLISLMASVPDPINLHVTNEHNTYDRLCQMKRIFMIPDDNLIITQSDTNGNFKNPGWPLKMFNEYYKPKQINVNGSIIDLDNSKQKYCVAIAGFYDKIPEDSNNEWPWCKQRPTEYWGKLFNHIKDYHYDVITVDKHMFDLEDKIEAMTKYCKAIISYEGGMAHLAHMLGIPCFMVDWTYPTASTNLDRFHCEFVHRTKNLYLLRDDEEIFTWDREHFDTKVFHLQNGKTNNRLVNGECQLSFSGSKDNIYGNIQVTNTQGEELLNTSGLYWVSDEHGSFLNKYHKVLK